MKILPHNPIPKTKTNIEKTSFLFVFFEFMKMAFDKHSSHRQKKNTVRTSMSAQCRMDGVIIKNFYVFLYLPPVSSLTFATSAACPALSPSLPLVFALYL